MKGLSTHQRWGFCMLFFVRTCEKVSILLQLSNAIDASSSSFCLITKTQNSFITVKDKWPNIYFSIQTVMNCHFFSISQTQVLEFDWRSAFRGLVPHMAHCVKVVLDDACAKSLQQEEALHSSGHTCITLSCTAGNTAAVAADNIHLREESSSTRSERETPKMIAKVLADYRGVFVNTSRLRDSCSDNIIVSVWVWFTVEERGYSNYLVGISLPQLDFTLFWYRQCI